MQRMQISNRGLFEWCERAIVGCVFLIAIFAPHSIAATQTAWLLGLVFWLLRFAFYPRPALFRTPVDYLRSEEHTSELQSQSNLVCRLLLEKKKKNNIHVDI